MGFGSAPKLPSVGMPPPAAHPAVLGSATVASTLKAQKDQADAGTFTNNNTVATSPQGLKTPPTTAKATLLG